MTKAAAVIGNLSDGFQIIGPFDDFDEAAEWAEGKGESWITNIATPDSYDFMEGKYHLELLELMGKAHGLEVTDYRGRSSPMQVLSGHSAEAALNEGSIYGKSLESNPRLKRLLQLFLAGCREIDDMDFSI